MKNINYMIGKKMGMTRLFLKNNSSVPVTILYFDINKLVFIKKIDLNKYLVQITVGKINLKKVKKSQINHFKKYNVDPGYLTKTFLINYNLSKVKNIDKFLNISYFTNFKYVNVTSKSKGKGFLGVIKRWNFNSQDSSHGNSLSHNVPGSIGQNQSPGRVFKGKKMPGHKGNVNITIKNIKIIKTDLINNLIYIKGNVPGYYKTNVIVKFINQ